MEWQARTADRGGIQPSIERAGNRRIAVTWHMRTGGLIREPLICRNVADMAEHVESSGPDGPTPGFEDVIAPDGRPVGIGVSRCYSYFFREMLSPPRDRAAMIADKSIR